MKKKEILRILLVVLIIIFLILGIAGVLLVGHRKTLKKQESKERALAALESVPKVTPTPEITITPTPTPTPIPTATPTPVIKREPAFNPDDYWDNWYSTDGTAAINIYDISMKSVSFSFWQGNADGEAVSKADVNAEVAGNAARFSFKDSQGNKVKGFMTFDKGQLYVKIVTKKQAEGALVIPSVNCVMTREKPAKQEESKSEAAAEPETPEQHAENTGDYYFPDSDSRYLTDKELSKYSQAELELAKNEIYARRGRIFVTDYIADYFNSKSWYKGTIEPEAFDASQDSIFNEYESANIMKILEWEKKRK